VFGKRNKLSSVSVNVPTVMTTMVVPPAITISSTPMTAMAIELITLIVSEKINN
jgi:hypothetical protein